MLTHSFTQSLPEFLPLVAAVQSLGRVRLSVTPWTTARQACLSFIISQILLKLMSIESVMPSNVCEGNIYGKRSLLSLVFRNN